MWKIILLVILLGIALAWFLIRPSYVTEGYGAPKEHHSLTKWGLVPLILAFLFVFFNSFTQVHAKEIGVGVSFGKPVAEYGAGVHFKPFWYSVTKINGTVYTDSYGTKGASNPALPVRLGDGNPATAAVSLRWHVSPDYGKMAQQINDQMVSAVKDSDGLPLVVIDKVTVAGITYSTATEARISGLVQQAAKTQQAVQLEATNTALSDANSKLKNSLTGPDGVKVLVQQCLQDLADGKITNQPGFSCWPGGSSGVVIPGNAAK
jgi:regulator of protease activity HflC (stomatin/prohibitin superfamily)